MVCTVSYRLGLELEASKRLYLPKNSAWWLLSVGCYSTEVLMQAAVGHEPQGGVKCACARETTAPMSSLQGSSQRHSTVFVHARMKPQPHGKVAYYVTLFVPTMQL